MSSRFLTFNGHSEATLREKASKFIAFAFPIVDENGFKQRCAAIAKEHHASRHVCYAWVLGVDGSRTRANDAGEPQGTAGKPILRRLQQMNVTNAACVVVRYFGGTLLGKAGLIRAYGDAALLAIEANSIVEQVIKATFTLQCSYTQVEPMRAQVIALGGEVLNAEFSEHCTMRIALPLDEVQRFTEHARLAGCRVM
jgi:uncharacterized YigZ family protein